jgi:hypothetical protein
MANRWTERFETPDGVDPNNPGTADRELRERSAAHLPEMERLEELIWQDMSETTFGVEWWRSHLAPRERILISHHLKECVSSVQENFLEAALHRLQLAEAREAEQRRLARAVTADGRSNFPPQNSPADLLPGKLVRLHLAGFFRALGSALDCAGAAAIGVLALPMDILRADFDRVKKYLDKQGTQRALWDVARVRLHDALRQAGPPNWDVWINDYRNMLVHRARRVEHGVFDVRWYVLDHAGRRVLNANPRMHLLRDPGLSDVEALAKQIDGPHAYLTEDAAVTVEEVFRSAGHLLRVIGDALADAWRVRHEDPGLVQQPSAQCPRMPSGRSTGFPGYAPSSLLIEPGAMFVSEESSRKLRFAALTDGPNALWKGLFDESA